MSIVSIKGLNLDKLLQKMQEKKICPSKVKRMSHDEIIIEISFKQYKNLIALNLSSCYNISVINKDVRFSRLAIVFMRFGLVIGFLLSFVIVCNLSSKIWQINVVVDGNNSVAITDYVKQELKNIGIIEGSSNKISTRQIEKQLLLGIDESAAVVVERNGVELNVFVKEQQPKPSLIGGNIVAQYDGVITQINYTSGILNVNIGESVCKGQDLIITGTVGDCYNEAKGEIVAKVRISGDAVGSVRTESVYRTGNYIDLVGFSLLGNVYYADNALETVEQSYDLYETQQCEVLISKFNVLPIKKIITRYYELKKETITMDSSEIISQLKSQAYCNAKNNLPTGAKELGISYDIFRNGDCYRVVCNIETEINIGIRNNV